MYYHAVVGKDQIIDEISETELKKMIKSKTQVSLYKSYYTIQTIFDFHYRAQLKRGDGLYWLIKDTQVLKDKYFLKDNNAGQTDYYIEKI